MTHDDSQLLLTQLLPAYFITAVLTLPTYSLTPRQAALPERELLHVADAHGH